MIKSVDMMSKKVAFVFLTVGFSVMLRAQTADEVITKYIAFTGGAQQWKKIKTLTSSGTYNYGGIEFPFIAYAKTPDLYKYIVTANGKSFMQAYDGKQGWRIDGFKDETTKTMLNGRQALAMANEEDVALESPFIGYAQKGHKIVLERKDTIDNRPCYRIVLLRKGGERETYFFDAGNYSLVKKQSISKNTELDNSMLDIFYSDYQATQGIKLPHTTRCSSGGQDILIITVKEVLLNQPVSDDIFKP